MTREDAYREGMAEGGYTPESIDFYINILKGHAQSKGIEPFSGPDWTALDDYIKRKTDTTCQKQKNNTSQR
jgi:hypothetical protein